MFTALKLVSSILPLLPKDKIECKRSNCTGSTDRSLKQLEQPQLPAVGGPVPPPPPGQKCDHYSTCGLPASVLNGTVPNVLLIGDSISESGSGASRCALCCCCCL
jgi:hypothetical protein